MKIPPIYSLTPEIIELITKIEAHRINFVSLKVPAPLKENIQRKSLLKSSLYSARIEGNPLELLDVSFEKSNEINKLEIFNILEASRFIETGIKEKIVTKAMLLELHRRVLKGIDKGTGHFRTEQSAIFNQAGVAVYMPSSPFAISHLLDELLLYINQNDKRFQV